MTRGVNPVFFRPRGHSSRIDLELLLTATNEAPGGCLEWNRYRDQSQYGRVQVDGKLWLAPRLAWTLLHGAIPDGLTIHHLCFNPPCINPNHLVLATGPENSSMRRVTMSRVCRKGHALSGSNLRVESRDGGRRSVRRCKTCSNQAARRRYADRLARRERVA